MPMPTMVNGRPVRTGSWEPAEDQALAEWQAKLGNRWASVAKHIPGRTGQQCAQRWRHRVNPDIRKEKWTEDEDVQLIELVGVHGSCWAEISRGMAGRTDQQCMGRWRRHLDPAINRAPWRGAEDAALAMQVHRHGSQWSRISRAFAGRTAQQCRARWFQLEASGMDADVEPPPPPATAPAGGRRGAGRAPATARARTQPGSYRAAEEEDCRVAALRVRLSQDTAERAGPSRGQASSRSTATAVAREARRASLMTTAANRPPGASPLGGSSGSELTHGGGGGGVRRRLTLSSYHEGDDEEHSEEHSPEHSAGDEEDGAAALEHSGGSSGWRPPFATPVRAPRTRYGGKGYGLSDGGGAAAASAGNGCGDGAAAGACAAIESFDGEGEATETEDEEEGTAAELAAAAAEARCVTPSPVQRTAAGLPLQAPPSPAGSCQNHLALDRTPVRTPPPPLQADASAPNSTEKCLMSPTQDCLTAQTLFATPVRPPPPAHASSCAADVAAAMGGETPQGAGFNAFGAAASPPPSSGGKWRLSPSHSIWALLQSPPGADGDGSRGALRSPTAFLEFASPERERSRFGSAQARAGRSRLGIGPGDGSNGPVQRPPVVRRLLSDLPNNGAVPCPREGPAAMPPPAKKARTAGAEPAAAQPQAAPATAAAGITSRASAAPAACAPHALAAGLADKPPPAAVQVQHYALVHPSVLASLRPGPHTLEQLSSAIYSSMAGQQQLQQLRQPASVPLPSSCGGLAKGFAHGAACAEPAARAPGGSSSSAAARSRLNALLEGS